MSTGDLVDTRQANPLLRRRRRPWRCAARRQSLRPSSPTRLFRGRFAGERWQRLATLGAHPQRPLRASTSTRNPAYPDTRYVDHLIGPDTVNTRPEITIAAFTDHGTLACTIDTEVDESAAVMRRLAVVGIDRNDVGLALDDPGRTDAAGLNCRLSATID